MTQEIVEKIKEAVDILDECTKEMFNAHFGYKCGMTCFTCDKERPNMYKRCHFYRDICSAIHKGTIAYRSAKNLLEYEETGKEELL